MKIPRKTKSKSKTARPSAAGAQRAKRAARKARREPTDLESGRYIADACRLLGLMIEPAWHVSIEANFVATLRLAASFMEFPLPDDVDPAPVFSA